MNPSDIVTIVVVVVAAVVVVLTAGPAHARKILLAEAEKVLAAERSRVEDLINRLAAKSLADYAHNAPTSTLPAPEPEHDYLFDATGLMAVEDTGHGEA